MAKNVASTELSIRDATVDWIEALRPFALEASSMWSLQDDVKICGIAVRHFRKAAQIVREYDNHHDLMNNG